MNTTTTRETGCRKARLKWRCLSSNKSVLRIRLVGWGNVISPRDRRKSNRRTKTNPWVIASSIKNTLVHASAARTRRLNSMINLQLMTKAYRRRQIGINNSWWTSSIRSKRSREKKVQGMTRSIKKTSIHHMKVSNFTKDWSTTSPQPTRRSFVEVSVGTLIAHRRSHCWMMMRVRTRWRTKSPQAQNRIHSSCRTCSKIIIMSRRKPRRIVASKSSSFVNHPVYARVRPSRTKLSA